MKAKILAVKAIFGTMRILTSLLMFLMITVSVWGQENSPKKLILETDYGLSPTFNVSSFTGKHNYSSSLGFGLHLFANHHFSKPDFWLVNRLGYSQLNYQIPDIGTKINTDNIHLDIGIKYPLSVLDNSSFIVSYSPYATIFAQSTYLGINNTTPKEVNLTPSLSNRLSHCVYAGFEFDFKEKASFELGYTFAINKTNTPNFLDAIPHNISFTYNLIFSDYIKGKSQLDLAKETIRALAKDTLYFINRSCPDELPNSQLKLLLDSHYNFSAYRVLEDSEIARVKNQPNVIHFAVIGSYYAGEGEPTSSGIYLLDKNLVSTDVPYPHFKQLEYDFGINKELCINGTSNAILLINWLNSKLYNY